MLKICQIASRMLITLLLWIVSSGLQAQVMVGDGTDPQDFSVLEISTAKTKGGLRLPHLTTEQRDKITTSPDFTGSKADAGRGLMIYNIDTDCIEVWNGSKWIGLCDGIYSSGTIGSLDCGTNSLTVRQGDIVATGNTFNIAYLGHSETNIILADNQPLGTILNGLGVVANGSQTLSTGNGILKIKVIGTPTATGNFNLPYSVGGVACSITVNSEEPCIPITTVSIKGTADYTLGETILLELNSLTPSNASNPIYQWCKNGIPLIDGGNTNGAKTKKLTIASAATTDIGSYTIEVVNACSKSGSGEIAVKVYNPDIISSLDCGTNNLNVIKGDIVAAGNTFSIPYLGHDKTNIILTDNQPLGTTLNGLGVVANGSQTLSAGNGILKIKVTGTPNVAGTFNLSYTVGGVACSITVNSEEPCIPITAVSIKGTAAYTAGQTILLEFNSLTPSNATTPTYQWYKDGVLLTNKGNISGAKTEKLYIKSAATTDMGNYTLKVSNPCSNTLESNAIAVKVLSFVKNFNVDTGTEELNTKGVFLKGTGDAKTRGTGVAHASMSVGVFRYINASRQVFNGATTTVNGITVNVPSRTLTNGSGELVVNVSGTPSASVAGKAFDIPITVLGQQLYVRVSIGCGAYTSMVRTIPSVGGDPTWLQFQCFNLGADQSLDPFKWKSDGKTVSYDIKGDLYQWGRKADGHQKRNSPGYTGTAPASGSLLDADGQVAVSCTTHYGQFITQLNGDWRSPPANLWGDGTDNLNIPKKKSDPCPSGWKVPSRAQFYSIKTVENSKRPNKCVWSAAEKGFFIGDALYLPAVGERITAGALVYYETSGGYWTSTPNVDPTKLSVYVLSFSTDFMANYSAASRANGHPIRCITE